MSSTTTITPTAKDTYFEVHVSKDTFKFTAAHFVAFKGFRERLHGHNYRVAVRLMGSRKIGPDGYVIDFGCVKDVVKSVCKELNEHFLCPTLSNVIDISTINEASGQESLVLVCEDGARFSFPKMDCAMLPIVHATAEELAIYLYGKILDQLDATYLTDRGIHTMEVNVAEAPGQDATFRLPIPEPDNLQSGSVFDIKQYIMTGEVKPRPCPLAAPKEEKKKMSGMMNIGGGGCVECQEQLLAAMEKLAEAINSGKLDLNKNGSVNGNDLQELI